MTQTGEEKLETAEQRRQVVALRRRGETFEAIGEELGFSRQRAHAIFKEALASIPAPEVTELRTEERDRLEGLMREAWKVLGKDHIAVSQGRVVLDPESGNPLLDDGPKLAAIKELRQLSESLRKLYGVDAPVKVDLSGGAELRVTIVGVDTEAMT